MAYRCECGDVFELDGAVETGGVTFCPACGHALPMSHSNLNAADLNEASLQAALEEVQASGKRLAAPLTHVVVSAEGLANARQLAKKDPEFARMALAEFGIDLLSES